MSLRKLYHTLVFAVKDEQKDDDIKFDSKTRIYRGLGEETSEPIYGSPIVVNRNIRRKNLQRKTPAYK